MDTIHNIKVADIDGNLLDFSAFKGKKLLIVNTASECGYTPQYTQLQELFDTFKDSIVVIGIPCNDFGGQEPGSDQQIKIFCTENYTVSFPLTTKLKLKGKEPAPLFQSLTKKELNGVKDVEIQWNFHKIVLDENGFIVNDFPSSVAPFDMDLLLALGIEE